MERQAPSGGKRHQVVSGINLLTLLWTDSGAKLPADCRLFNTPVDGIDKNQHVRAMLATAKQRGFAPRYVCFDSWYSGLDNLKAVRDKGWAWLTRLKRNRAVNPDDTDNRAIYLLDIPPQSQIVHLRGYGLIRVFVLVSDDREDVQFWATSDLAMTKAQRRQLATQTFAIEEYHRGLKQCCGVERCQARTERIQRNHILFALRAFVRLEHRRCESGRSWYESKKQVVRAATRAYRASPHLTPATTA